MSLIAAAGDFAAQAQRGRMQLAAQEDMSVESVNGVVHVKAAKEIILNVDGTYVKLSGAGVEIGSRGGVLYRTAGVKGTGPAQMNLGGAAFAPKFVPYTTGCEVWRTHPGFVPPPAVPAPLPAQWQAPANTGAVASAPDAGGVAPSPLGDFFSRQSGGGVPASASAFSPFDGQPSSVDSGISKAKVTLNNPDDQQACVAPDPIKLVNAVPCDWKSTDLKADVSEHIEATLYWGRLDNRTPWKSKDGATWYRGGGSRDSNFEFAYSEQDKTITCTVRVMLVPMELFPVDARGNRELSAQLQSIPYESPVHYQLTPGATRKRIKMDYREAVGNDYDVAALRNRIEAVLNQGGYKLILDGCSKGAACGCRVKVNFKADLRVSIRGEPISGFREHVLIHLFPSILRADTSAWGEQQKMRDDQGGIHNLPRAHVEAHECGHYFNFPDEYYDQGGWLHESYINNEQIDFSLVDAKAGTPVWQGRSQSNLMGYGANLPFDQGRATLKPYYLEYVRRQFSLATNKLWRVGYDA
ncbi:DUF2345 domain-containing protein [Paraburkholderia acidipaludis]|uniref:DUF2345 domain-containing protein n=1 Tax=Paraburkholderia acidipaludis TaxID=660537 RepID=UPI000484911D|nr:DUF2345 domain-containing protein [Paraburkholderia acidipaludis]